MSTSSTASVRALATVVPAREEADTARAAGITRVTAYAWSSRGKE